MQDTPKLIEVLKLAKQLLTEGRWIQNGGAQNENGDPVNADDPKACAFCFMGAVWQAEKRLYPDVDDDDWSYYEEKLNRFFEPRGHKPLLSDIFAWNDTKGRTKSEVLAKFDEIIRDEQRKTRRHP